MREGLIFGLGVAAFKFALALLEETGALLFAGVGETAGAGIFVSSLLAPAFPKETYEA
jgi:hypothetical protein